MANSDRETLPDPDFSWDPTTNPPIAGLRPRRATSYRLEPETFGPKLVVHNYGHGIAGITMSWGCAQEIVDVSNHRVSPNQAVAVLGSGVMGLTAAASLAQLNLRVTIYAKAFPPHTTPNVAGGQWAPSLVEHRDTQQFDRILRRSFATHSSKLGHGYGVSTRVNYTPQRSPNFEVVPRDVIPQPEFFNHLPFKHLTSPGYAYATSWSCCRLSPNCSTSTAASAICARVRTALSSAIQKKHISPTTSPISGCAGQSSRECGA